MSSPIAKKSLGQHWLHDLPSLEEMASNISPGDTVLEIGPGTGTLTEVILTKKATVIAVEKDTSLLGNLHEKYDQHDFTLINQSILEFDLTKLPKNYKVVANIPYYLTSNLIRVLSESTNPPESATLLVQKEVAQRVAAIPGDMSLLSVTAQYFWHVSLGSVVPAQLFTPPPKVDSQILILKRREQALFSQINEKEFFRIVKAGFGERRKTLGNSLSGGLRKSKEEVHNLLETAGIDSNLRAQALSLEQWYRLYKEMNT